MKSIMNRPGMIAFILGICSIISFIFMFFTWVAPVIMFSYFGLLFFTTVIPGVVGLILGIRSRKLQGVKSKIITTAIVLNSIGIVGGLSIPVVVIIMLANYSYS